MSYSNRVDTTTEDFLVPKVVDTILKENTLVRKALSKVKKFKSATQLFPIKYQKGVAGTSFSGFDTLPTSASDTRVNLTFTPKFYATNVALPGTEMAVNNTENQVLNLAEIEMRSRAQDMADDLGTMFYSDGTGNGSKDFLGLSAIVDDGSTAATYGGLTRATYTGLNSTVTASSGTLTLLKMRTLYNAISDGDIAPTSILSTKAVLSYYEQLLQPQERIYKTASEAGALKGFTGYKTLEYIGMPVMTDRKCTSGVMFFLNDDYLDFYAVGPIPGYTPAKIASSDIIGNDYDSVPGLGFTWSGWIKPSNAVAFNGFITLGGQFLSDNPGRHGKLTGITGV